MQDRSSNGIDRVPGTDGAAPFPFAIQSAAAARLLPSDHRNGSANHQGVRGHALAEERASISPANGRSPNTTIWSRKCSGTKKIMRHEDFEPDAAFATCERSCDKLIETGLDAMATTIAAMPVTNRVGSAGSNPIARFGLARTSVQRPALPQRG